MSPSTEATRRAFLHRLGLTPTRPPSTMLAPPALRPGDPVSLIAPETVTVRNLLEAGLAKLGARYSFQPWGPSARAVFSAREGCIYGADACEPSDTSSLRLVPELPLAQPGRPLVGCSDLTALHAALQCAGRISIHGPVLTQLGRLGDEDLLHLIELLETPSYRPCLTGQTLHAGPAVEGRVLGGNLTVFSRLIGTPYLPPVDGAILFLEEISEPLYRIDAIWRHLEQAGVLRRIAGLAFGTWVNCDGPEAMLAQLAREAALPCLTGLPCGHGNRNVAFPLGARARLDTEHQRLVFLEGAVSAD